MTKVIGVRFRTAGKVYFFDPLQLEIKRGDRQRHRVRHGRCGSA